MADIKTRRPYRLSDTDYDDWFSNWVAWFLAFPNTPEFANWLRAGLYALDADYYDKLVAVDAAQIAQDNATKMWNQSVKNLRQILVKLRISLPTLTPGDDSVLDTLNLRKEVPPRDADDLKIYAQLVDDTWQPLSADPQYAPFADRLNLIAPLMTEIGDRRIVMTQAIFAYSTACDEKTAAREACNTRERAVFNYFRGEGVDSTFWTSSPYGMPGGGGEEPVPGENPFPNPLTGLKAEINELGHISVRADEQSGAAKYNFYVDETMPGEQIHERPPEAEWKLIGIPSIMDTQHNPGTVKTYWACGVDENGVEGEFCEPVSVAIM